MNLRGRQTQFYIDILYGIAFAGGFGYLLFIEMDPRIAAFQGGLILGYFLRVWENMSVYERILQEEIAAEAQEAVAVEVEDQLPLATETQVAEEMGQQIGKEIDQRLDKEMHDRLAEEVRAQVDNHTQGQSETEAKKANGSEKRGS